MMCLDDKISRSVRACLAAHGYPVAPGEESPPVAVADNQALHIALLTENEQQARAWTSRLASTMDHSSAVCRPLRNIQLQVQSWHEPLQGGFHEIHVVDASKLPNDLLEGLEQRAELLSLHGFMHSPCVPRGFRWDSEEALGICLDGLIATLAGQSVLGMQWDDYRLHHRQPGQRYGVSAQGPGWHGVLWGLLSRCGDYQAATSAVLFLDGGKQLTLGEYVDVYDALEAMLPDRCLISVCQQARLEEGYRLTLWVTTAEPANAAGAITSRTTAEATPISPLIAIAG